MFFISQVPELTDATSCMLSVTGSSRNMIGEYVNGLSFEEEKSIRLDVKGMSVFIQTDKAIYKPSQKGRKMHNFFVDIMQAFQRS